MTWALDIIKDMVCCCLLSGEGGNFLPGKNGCSTNKEDKS